MDAFGRTSKGPGATAALSLKPKKPKNALRHRAGREPSRRSWFYPRHSGFLSGIACESLLFIAQPADYVNEVLNIKSDAKRAEKQGPAGEK
jgi:hypothetical protein